MLEALRSRSLGRHESRAGVASASPPRGPGGDLLRDADLAMYQAKAQGRDRVVSFDCEMHAAMVAGVAMENDLRRALDADELYLAFQPIVDLETGALRAAEALLRWDHPRHGNVSPGEFIPLAEETRPDRADRRVGARGGVPHGGRLGRRAAA